MCKVNNWHLFSVPKRSSVRENPYSDLLYAVCVFIKYQYWPKRFCNILHKERAPELLKFHMEDLCFTQIRSKKGLKRDFSFLKIYCQQYYSSNLCIVNCLPKLRIKGYSYSTKKRLISWNYFIRKIFVETQEYEDLGTL